MSSEARRFLIFLKCGAFCRLRRGWFCSFKMRYFLSSEAEEHFFEAEFLSSEARRFLFFLLEKNMNILDFKLLKAELECDL